MIDRILRWLGWGRPQEGPVRDKKSSAEYRLQGYRARSDVDGNRRPQRGGTGTGPNHSRQSPSSAEVTDGQKANADSEGNSPAGPDPFS
jgi:hypothetical protein